MDVHKEVIADRSPVRLFPVVGRDSPASGRGPADPAAGATEGLQSSFERYGSSEDTAPPG